MITLTDRDRWIVLALLFRVPLLAESVLGRRWPDTDAGRENMARRLWQLCDIGLLARYTLPVQAAAGVALFYRWSPGDPDPDFGPLAWELSRRWAAVESRRVVFYTATATAARRYGQTVRNPLRSASAVAHNLGLGQVFDHFDLYHPALAAAWVAEEVVAAARGHGEKVVDSVVVDSTATPALAIEFAGSSYAHSNGERLREVHRDCALRRLPYEMWTVSGGGGT
ncbi:MAG: hypothetical protein K2X87_30350 [Gemmataceae bacterium]|nr:hypothetical protein [Gemmataceae bacterium]